MGFSIVCPVAVFTEAEPFMETEVFSLEFSVSFTRGFKESFWLKSPSGWIFKVSSVMFLSDTLLSRISSSPLYSLQEAWSKAGAVTVSR